MAAAKTPRWQFAARFRRSAFGWRSQPAIARVREAVVEIRKAARRDPVLGAEGAVLFLEKVSAALEDVDSSSGAIGAAVNRAIEELAMIIGKAPAELSKRAQWLERLWDAYMADAIPYIETLADFWGDLCARKELASAWADNLLDPLRASWQRQAAGVGTYFQGTTVCLSSLLAAGRRQELLELLAEAPHVWWEYRRWGVQALVAMGRADAALAYAEASRGLNDNPARIAQACEEILLALGRPVEAYERYAIQSNRSSSYLTTYRAMVRKYPALEPVRILSDLVAATPGEEGKWFAAAKEAGLLELAIQLVNQSPCDPKTLTRAARDFAVEQPLFALEAGLAALRWLAQGYGYEIDGADVWAAYLEAMRLAERLDRRDQVRAQIHKFAAGNRFMTEVLGRELGLASKTTESVRGKGKI
jgi:hypothetical protein